MTFAAALMPRRAAPMPTGSGVGVAASAVLVLSISPADELRATADIKALVAFGSADGESPEAPEEQEQVPQCRIYIDTRQWSHGAMCRGSRATFWWRRCAPCHVVLSRRIYIDTRQK